MGAAEFSGICVRAVVLSVSDWVRGLASMNGRCDAGIECFDGRLIFADPGQAQVRVGSTGFDKGFVHGSNRQFVLSGDGLQRATSFAGIAKCASEQPQVSGCIDKDAELQFFAESGYGEQQDAFQQDNGGRLNNFRL